MNESMESRLIRLLSENKIPRIDVKIKCKTRDGMTYTLLTQECHRKDVPMINEATSSDNENGMYASWIVTVATQNVLEFTDIVGRGDSLLFTLDELMSIRHGEIVRIWAELGDVYHEGPVVI